MFEKATRLKLRFDHKGLLTVEDLWDLPLKELDTIYSKLSAEAKAAQQDSLLNTRTDDDRQRELKMEIVKYIVTVKLEEKEAAKNRAERKDKKARIMQILAEKQEAELYEKSPDELRQLMESL